MSFKSVVCYQVELSVAVLSPIQRSLTECGVSECDLQARDQEGCRAMKKKKLYSSRVIGTSDLIKQKDGQKIVWGK